MYNCPAKSKSKKPITDENKLRQIKSWNESDISKQPTAVRSKKVRFDATTRFLDACINFYKDEINDLLNKGVDINCSDKDNLTAIHQACINSRIDLVDYLLSKNANINVCDKEGWTPLHIAADIGSYELAKFLIDHGARLDVANYDGDLPIMFVNENEYPDLKSYLQKEMDKRKINSEECSNYEKVYMLEDVKKWKVNNSYNPPIDRINKSTPVHVAASKNYVEVLSELLPLLTKEDINAQDIDGWTALHAAAHWGNREACSILIKHGADLNIRTRANEGILDLIDPDLKLIMGEEIQKLQKENEMLTHEIPTDIPIRTDNRRSKNNSRSSIIRQSVEYKKNCQMKDPIAEGETLVKALNSDSSGINTIEECDEKMISLKDYQMEYGKINIDKSSEIGEIKLSHPANNEADSIPNKSLNFSQKFKSSFDKEIIQLSNGNNLINNLVVLTPEIKITESNNDALIHEIDAETNSDSEIFKLRETEVRLRPKSTRDAIIAHRSTMDRTSLVMAPAKSDEAEVMRREKARRVRSMRRSTQAIDLGGYKDLEKTRLTINTDASSESKENIDKVSNSYLEKNNGKENHLSDYPTESTSTDKKYNDFYKYGSKSCDIVKKDETAFDFSKNNKTKGINHPDNPTENSAEDLLDSDSVTKRTALKYQVSCPTSHPSQSYKFNRARLTISNTLKDLVKKDPIGPQKSITTNPNINTILTPSRGLNVNRCIAAGDFDKNNDSTIKSADYKFSAYSDHADDKDSGSFIARPVFGHSNDENKLLNQELIHAQSSIDKEDCNETSSASESSDAVCLKDENQISKMVITKMLNDQTVKQEFQKEIFLLNAKLKETKEKLKQSESKNTTNIKIEQNDSNDRIQKLEMENSKLRDENKILKSQNEALLRVVSRIQQELESFRKVPLI